MKVETVTIEYSNGKVLYMEKSVVLSGLVFELISATEEEKTEILRKVKGMKI